MKLGIFSSLNRPQKEAIGLLQIGTFLEYFDLMLYVHMAVLMNELFFPKTDPHTAALLTAFAFCSTFVLRPFGALIFGWIGDNIGRKATVIITTTMMAVSCIIMANLPTYAQIGISAAWIVTLCRIAQGISSMGEFMGTQIYITEITKPPVQYPAVALVVISTSLGSTFALGVAALVTHFGFNWRLAFWMGAAIAVVGSIARTKLHETPDFIVSKFKKEHIKKTGKGPAFMEDNTKLSSKTLLAFFLIYCGWPLSFYLTFMYFNPTLKGFGYTPEDIISHNFFVCMVSLVSSITFCILSYSIHPLTLIKNIARVRLPFTVLLPSIIYMCSTPMHIFLIQSAIIFLALCSTPSDPILLKALPVLKRFTASSFLYALSRSIVYVITSFSLVYFTHYFGHFGLWAIMIPLTLGFLWSVKHFETLEKKDASNMNAPIEEPASC